MGKSDTNTGRMPFAMQNPGIVIFNFSAAFGAALSPFHKAGTRSKKYNASKYGEKVAAGKNSINGIKVGCIQEILHILMKREVYSNKCVSNDNVFFQLLLHLIGEEDNYFFALSKYQKSLEETLNKNPNFVQPSLHLNEVQCKPEGCARNMTWEVDKKLKRKFPKRYADFIMVLAACRFNFHELRA